MSRCGHVSIRKCCCQGEVLLQTKDWSAWSSVSGACVLTAGGCPLGLCGRPYVLAGCVALCTESPRSTGGTGGV